MDHVSLDLQVAFTKIVPAVKSLERLSYKANMVLCASTIATVLCALQNLCWVDIGGCTELYFTQVKEVCTKCTKLHTFN